MTGVERPNRELIGRICDACVTSLPVTGAAVSAVLSGGHHGTAFATDAVAAQLEDLQFELGEGPGVDAFGSGSPVLVGDLIDSTGRASARWPAFTPAAVRAGAHSVFAYPLLLGAARIGLLDLYRNEAIGLDAAAQARAARLAGAALVTLLDLIDETDSTSWLPGETLPADGAGSGFFRAEVYQAAGMVKVQLGVSIEDAIIRMRAYAFSHDRRLPDVAAEVVARRLRLEADND